MIIIMVKNMRYNNKIYTVCYDTLDVFNTKEEAKKFYSECYYMSEGAEQERYASILIDLNFSNLGKDHVSTNCREIAIKLESKDEFLNIKINDYLSIDDTIKYFDGKVLPILEISEESGINFTKEIPFEDFGSDEESDYMNNFSEYYMKILNSSLIDTIETIEISDGKYEMNIYPSMGDKFTIDVRAWDKLDDVLNNVSSIEKELNIEKNYEI